MAISLNQIFFKPLNIMLLLQNTTSFSLGTIKPPAPSFEIFCVLLNEKILCDRTFAFKNNTLRKFRAKYLCLGGCALLYFFLFDLVYFFFFFLFFGVRDTSIVSIVSSI